MDKNYERKFDKKIDEIKDIVNLISAFSNYGGSSALEAFEAIDTRLGKIQSYKEIQSIDMEYVIRTSENWTKVALPQRINKYHFLLSRISEIKEKLVIEDISELDLIVFEGDNFVQIKQDRLNEILNELNSYQKLIENFLIKDSLEYQALLREIKPTNILRLADKWTARDIYFLNQLVIKAFVLNRDQEYVITKAANITADNFRPGNKESISSRSLLNYEWNVNTINSMYVMLDEMKYELNKISKELV